MSTSLGTRKTETCSIVSVCSWEFDIFSLLCFFSMIIGHWITFYFDFSSKTLWNLWLNFRLWLNIFFLFSLFSFTITWHWSHSCWLPKDTVKTVTCRIWILLCLWLRWFLHKTWHWINFYVDIIVTWNTETGWSISTAHCLELRHFSPDLFYVFFFVMIETIVIHS